MLLRKTENGNQFFDQFHESHLREYKYSPG